MVTRNFDVNKESGEISIKELFGKIGRTYKYLLSKWRYLLFFFFIGGVLGFTYAYFKKSVFTATTTFVLETGESGGSLGQYAGLASMAGIDLGGGGGGLFQGENILQLYKSRTMIEKTLLSEIVYNGKSELLLDRYIEFNNLRKAWNEKPQLANLKFTSADKRQASKFTRIQDSVLGKIVEDINSEFLMVSKPDKKLSIIKVDVNSDDEFFAKTFNDQIVKNVNDFYVQTKTKKSLKNIVILQQKTDSVRLAMNKSIYSAAEVIDATPNLNPTRQVQRIVPVQRSQFSTETNKAILGELVKNLEMSKMALLKETPLIQVVDFPVFPLLKAKLSRIKSAIVGALIFGLLAVIVLLVGKFLRSHLV